MCRRRIAAGQKKFKNRSALSHIDLASRRWQIADFSCPWRFDIEVKSCIRELSGDTRRLLARTVLVSVEVPSCFAVDYLSHKQGENKRIGLARGGFRSCRLETYVRFWEDDFQLSFFPGSFHPFFKILNENCSVSNLGALAAFERELKQRGCGRQSPFRHCVSFNNVIATRHLPAQKTCLCMCHVTSDRRALFMRPQPLAASHRLGLVNGDKPHPQLVKDLFDHFGLFLCAVASGFLQEHLHRADEMLRLAQVGLRLSRDGMRDQAQGDQGLGGQGGYQEL